MAGGIELYARGFVQPFFFFFLILRVLLTQTKGMVNEANEWQYAINVLCLRYVKVIHC